MPSKNFPQKPLLFCEDYKQNYLFYGFVARFIFLEASLPSHGGKGRQCFQKETIGRQQYANGIR